MLIDLTDVPFTPEQGRHNVYRDEIQRQTNFSMQYYGFNGDVIDMTITADMSAPSLLLLMSLRIKIEHGVFVFARLVNPSKYRNREVLLFEFEREREVRDAA